MHTIKMIQDIAAEGGFPCSFIEAQNAFLKRESMIYALIELTPPPNEPNSGPLDNIVKWAKQLDARQ